MHLKEPDIALGMVAATLYPGTNLICKTKLDHFRVKETIIGIYDTDDLVKSVWINSRMCF